MTTEEKKNEETPAPAQIPVADRIKDEELRQHEVPEVLTFLRDNGLAILIGVAVAVALFVGVSVYRNYKKTAAEQASVALFQAQTPDQVQKVLDDYSATPIAPVAALSLASDYFNAGQFELAEHHFAQFLSRYPDNSLAVVAELGQAQCKEATGRLDEALEGFKKLRSGNESHYLAPLALFGEARTLEQLKRFDEAKSLYEDFIAANPTNQWLNRAEASLLYVDMAKRAATVN